jgi:hypothetical protein
MSGYPQAPASRCFTLRDLPLAARLTLAVFLISVGIGYVSALVQLHFQHASPGQLLPTTDDAVRVFFGQTGDRPKSKIEQLLPELDQGSFNGSGQMTSAFTKRSEDLKKAISDRAKTLAKKTKANAKDPAILEAAETEVRQERDTERLSILAWIQAGASEKEYNDDAFPLPGELANRPMTSNYLVSEEDKVVEPHTAKIKTLLQDRCVRCHAPEGEDAQAIQFPLDSYAHLKPYITVQTSSGMSLTKLAQTTHVHLLGFSMLYGLTGLILAFSSYPRILRIVLCPLPLLAQVVDISFWWLARLPEPHGPMFARAIVISGAVVAVGLLLHIVLGLFNLFSKKTWLVLILLFAAAGYAGYMAKERVIDPFIAQETQEKAPAKAE